MKTTAMGVFGTSNLASGGTTAIDCITLIDSTELQYTNIMDYSDPTLLFVPSPSQLSQLFHCPPTTERCLLHYLQQAAPAPATCHTFALLRTFAALEILHLFSFPSFVLKEGGVSGVGAVVEEKGAGGEEGR